MKRCKWSGDKSDNYCVSCDGVEMMVEGVKTSCSKCAGYEPGEEEVLEGEMNPPTEDLPFEEEKKEDKVPTPKPVKPAVKEKKPAQVKNTEEKKKPVTTGGTKEKPVNKVVETIAQAEEETVETPEGIKVVSLAYTSGCTINHNDTYYKFIAEEKWDLTNYKGDVQEARDMLWAQLNTEVDNQVAEAVK